MTRSDPDVVRTWQSMAEGLGDVTEMVIENVEAFNARTLTFLQAQSG
jgi:hypothetical protein